MAAPLSTYVSRTSKDVRGEWKRGESEDGKREERSRGVEEDMKDGQDKGSQQIRKTREYHRRWSIPSIGVGQLQ
jgi:hypothetical protein